MSDENYVTVNTTTPTRLIEGAFYWTMHVMCFEKEGEKLVHGDRVAVRRARVPMEAWS